MNRVRFHLGAGPHYMQWQISTLDGDKRYVSPTYHQIVMKGCRLRSRRKAAEQIHQGANKSVCAWVECQEIEICPAAPSAGDSSQIHYNPRVAPHWVDDNQDADGRTYPLLHTNGRGIFRPAA